MTHLARASVREQPPLPGISVVICAYTMDRWDDLVTAVEAVRAQTHAPGEVIVVIDHNRHLWLRAQREIPGVTVIENLEARGLSGARNSGIQASRGEIIAFIDEDALPASDWLAQLSLGYTDDNVLGVGGAIEPLWPDTRPGWFPEEFDWVVGCTYLGMPRSTAPVRNLIGCNMSFRREIFETIGGFRHGIGRIGKRPFGCEETELCIRARQHWPQGVLRYVPHARVFHRIPASRLAWRYFCSRCYFEGRSKAIVARLVGSTDGLASERSYTFRTLPLGVSRGLGDTLLRGDGAGLMRAGAILLGLGITIGGYLAGNIVLTESTS